MDTDPFMSFFSASGKEESEVDCTSPATLEIINEIYGHKFTKVTRKESVPWTEEENAALLQAMEIFGTKWRRVADHMKTRDNSEFNNSV